MGITEFLWEFVPQEGWRQIGKAAYRATAGHRGYRQGRGRRLHCTPTRLAERLDVKKPTAHEARTGLVQKGALRVFAGKYYPTGE